MSSTQQQTTASAQGFDAVFDYVGDLGIYQWRLLGIVSIQMMVLTFHHVGFVFLGAVPKHWCYVDSLQNSGWTVEQIRNISIPSFTFVVNGVLLIRNPNEEGSIYWNECSYYDLNYTDILQTHASFESAAAFVDSMKHLDDLPVRSCREWVYDKSIYASTVVSQFNLVCENRAWVATIQASYMGGVLVGSLVLSTLSDKVFGRRLITITSVFIVISAGLGAAFAPNYAVFLALRFFVAIGVAGSFQSCYVLLLEYAGPSCRAFLGIIEQLPFAIGSMLIPLLAYFFRNWSDLQLSFTLSALSLLSYIWILPESSRWLASRGKTEMAVNILQNVAKVNGKQRVDSRELRAIVEGCQEKSLRPSKEIHVWNSIQAPLTNFFSLLSTPNLRNRSLALWTLYFSVTVIYYGLSFLSVRLSSDPYVLFFLSGLMEVPAYCGITVPIVSRWGRKFVIIISFVITAICLFGLVFTPLGFPSVRISLTLIGKLFVSCGFAIIYLLGAELYPTTMRTTGLGSAIIIGRFGSMVAPYFVDLKGATGADSLPVILFGCVAIMAAGVGFTLPETTTMPDNIEDVENEPTQRLSEIIGSISQLDLVLES